MTNHSTEGDDKEFPRKGASQNGNTIGYSVEVRSTFNKPAAINGMLLDERWQRARFDKVPPPIPGVPNAKPWNASLFGMMDLFDYSSAQALRWWFHANAEQGMSHMCLESRIVAHKVVYSWSEEAISEHELVGGEDRTSIVPDWNTEKQPR